MRRGVQRQMTAEARIGLHLYPPCIGFKARADVEPKRGRVIESTGMYPEALHRLSPCQLCGRAHHRPAYALTGDILR